MWMGISPKVNACRFRTLAKKFMCSSPQNKIIQLNACISRTAVKCLESHNFSQGECMQIPDGGDVQGAGSAEKPVAGNGYWAVDDSRAEIVFRDAMGVNLVPKWALRNLDKFS
jgi:hypothetical protein